MIVNDLNVECIRSLPEEAQPPLIIDTDTVLASSVARKLLEAVARRDSEIFKALRGVEDEQLFQGRPLDGQREAARALALENGLGVSVAEGPYHRRG